MNFYRRLTVEKLRPHVFKFYQEIFGHTAEVAAILRIVKVQI